MKTEFLKELGLEKEAIDKIMAENGRDIEAFKGQVTTLTAERDTMKTQIAEADTKIKEFADLDVEGVKKAAGEWEKKAKEAEKERDAQIAALKFDHALEGKLAGAKAKDASILLGLLKRDDLKITADGNILGLDDQLAKLKEEKGFLFEEESAPPRFAGSTPGVSTQTDNKKDEANAAMRQLFGRSNT